MTDDTEEKKCQDCGLPMKGHKALLEMEEFRQKTRSETLPAWSSDEICEVAVAFVGLSHAIFPRDGETLMKVLATTAGPLIAGLIMKGDPFAEARFFQMVRESREGNERFNAVMAKFIEQEVHGHKPN